MTGVTVLDGCCGAGLAADGYASVGLHTTGWDVNPQPHYPYPFTQGDLREYLLTDDVARYDLLHFSWPCQAHTTAGHLRTAQGGKARYEDLLTPGLGLVRERWGHKPYVFENVDDRSKLIVPAELEGKTLVYLQELAIDAFRALDLAGLARVDLFMERPTDHIFVNEVNTLPGFTAISMYPRLWEASGVPLSELVDRLIGLALERHADRRR